MPMETLLVTTHPTPPPMVHYTDVTKFLAQAHDMQKSTSCRLLIKYSLGNLKLKLTDDVNVSGTFLYSWPPAPRHPLPAYSLLLCPLTPIQPSVHFLLLAPGVCFFFFFFFKTITYSSKQRDDLKHMDKLSLLVLTDAVAALAPGSAAAVGVAASDSGAGKGSRGGGGSMSGAQSRKAKRSRWAAGEDEEGYARHLARKKAKEEKEEERRERRRVRREERQLAQQMMDTVAKASGGVQ